MRMRLASRLGGGSVLLRLRLRLARSEDQAARAGCFSGRILPAQRRASAELDWLHAELDALADEDK